MNRRTFMEKLYDFVSARPKKILIGAAVLTGILMFTISGASIQTNIHEYIDQKYIGPLDYIREHFDEQDILSVTIEAPEGLSVLSLDLIKEQDRFFTEVENKWPVEVDDLTRVLNKHIGSVVQDIQNLDDEYIFAKMFQLYDLDPYEFERIARKAISNKSIVDMLQEMEILKQYIGIIPGNIKIEIPPVKALRATINTKGNLSRNERKEIFAGIQEMAANFSGKIKIRLFATELIEKEVDTRGIIRSPYVIGFMILLLIGALYATFRSVYFTLVPIFILSVAIFWAFGTAALLGMKNISFLHVIAIPLLLGQCIDNLIHFNERFREEYGEKSKKEAIRIVFITAGKAAALTTFLNMTAFASDWFTTNLTPIKEYCLIILLGLGLALAATYIVGASILLVSNLHVSKKSMQVAKKGSNFARKLFDFVIKYKIPALIISFAALAGMIFSITRVDTRFNTSSFMTDSFASYDAYMFEQENFKVYLPHFVLIRGDIATQTALEAITKIEQILNNMDDVEYIHNRVNTESLNYLLNKFDEKSLPKDIHVMLDAVLQSDILINWVGGLESRDVAPHIIEKTDDAFPATVIKFWPAETDSFAIKRIADAIIEGTSEFKENLDIQPTGFFMAFSRTMDSIVWSGVYAVVITLLIIMFFLWWTFKRISTSLLTSIPIIFGSIFALGMLPILNIELNALNGTVGVLAAGLGIDYAIQMMSRYHEELIKQKSPLDAMRETYAHMVMPLAQCVGLTTAGLFVLVNLMPITGKFGIAGAVSLIVCYLGAIVIMPIFAIKVIKTVPEKMKKNIKSA